MQIAFRKGVTVNWGLPNEEVLQTEDWNQRSSDLETSVDRPAAPQNELKRRTIITRWFIFNEPSAIPKFDEVKQT